MAKNPPAKPDDFRSRSAPTNDASSRKMLEEVESTHAGDGNAVANSDGQDDALHAIHEALGPLQVIEVVHAYAEALKARRKGIDRLNVYPVPDGDTGTNMSLTMQSVIAELKHAAHDDMCAVAAAISKGATLGARGNSGAILAQVLRGISETIHDKHAIGPHDLAEALDRARMASYQAVVKPVEGTILTVVSAASGAAKTSVQKGHHLKDQLTHVREAAADALARTPELLPILKQAGVVDAGGSGFMLLVDALRYVVTGEPIPGEHDDATDADADVGVTTGEHGALGDLHTELSDLRYEVMFLFSASDEVIPAFRQRWSTLGDSIVVVGGDGTWNCHIHGDDIGAMIEAALEFGRPYNIRVTDLQEQAHHVHGEEWTPTEPHVAQQDVSQHDVLHESNDKQTGVVVVTNGAGLRDAFVSLGVDRVVVGGQSMNPSVGELLEAVNAVTAHDVLVVPNNKNIIPAAKQLDALSEKHVMVLPTTSSAAGLAVLMDYQPGLDGETNERMLALHCASVRTAEVTQAVRDANVPFGAVKQGQWMAIVDGEAISACTTMAEALCVTIPTLVEASTEVVTLIAGEGASDDATQAFEDAIARTFPTVTIEHLQGGQPLYPYLISAE